MNTIDIIGEEQTFDKVVDRTIESFEDDILTTIGAYSFSYCDKLTTINLPELVGIGNGSFSNCTSLVNISLPKITAIGSETF